VAKKSQGWQDDAVGGGRADGSERALGAEAAAADEEAGRCGGGAWIAGQGFKSEAAGQDQAVRSGDFAQTGLARFRTDVCG
jgi:hypothetical protein